jgi:hypothetical protein
MHIFTLPKIAYQDFRIMMQMSFLALENYHNSKGLENFESWLKKDPNIKPSIPYNEPNAELSGFEQLFYYRTFTSRAEESLQKIKVTEKMKEIIGAKFKKSIVPIVSESKIAVKI